MDDMYGRRIVEQLETMNKAFHAINENIVALVNAVKKNKT